MNTRMKQQKSETASMMSDIDELDTIGDRIEQERGELFAVYATIGVLRDSINPDKDFDRYKVLDELYGRVDTIAGKLDSIATDARSSIESGVQP